MTTIAFLLIAISAVTHATWNLSAKRASGGAAFTVLITAVAALLYAPITLAFVLWQQPSLDWIDIGFILFSSVLQMLYFFFLNRGYSTGDLSLVYPLARGVGPLLAMVVAIALLGERPNSVVVVGALFIGAGALVLTRSARNTSVAGGANQRAAVTYALLVAAMIASYTVWDKIAVSQRMIPPLVVNWGVNAGLSLIMLPYGLRHRALVRDVWTRHRREVLVVGILYPFSYTLVLTAMVFTPVSYVAPARELSILIGALMGARLLSEGQTMPRLVGATVMVLGVIALAFG